MTANCHQIEDEFWTEVLDGMDMTVSPLEGRPGRSLQFNLDLPIEPQSGDTLQVTAGTDREDVVYAGPVPDSARIMVTLPANTRDGPMRYVMGFQVIRPDEKTICSWSGEEIFELPALPFPAVWRVSFLSQPDATEDGGTRWTRFDPL